MRKIGIFFLFFGFVFRAHSQSVFTLDIKKDVLLGTLALGTIVSPLLVSNDPERIPAGLNKDDVNAFDRPFMFSYNRPLDIASDYGAYGLLALPLLSLAGNVKSKSAWLTYGVMYAQAFCLTFGTRTLKNAIIRYRPYMYFAGLPAGVPSGKEKDYYNSFPSGSTAVAFLSAGFLSAAFSAEYPDSLWKIPVIGGSYALAAGVAVCRIYSGSHFLTDVLTGAAIGSLWGWLIPALHKKREGENAVAIAFTGNTLLVSFTPAFR